MSRFRLHLFIITSVLLVVAGLLFWAAFPSATGRPHIAASSQAATALSQESPRFLPAAANERPLPGETILRGFADSAQPPAHDLMLLHRCLDTFLLAAKGMKEQPLSANGEIANALRGGGLVKMPFLRSRHPIFNAGGLLTDRWGTPFFFHTEQAGAIAIRSAGPDKIMWTADDLHRLPNGVFLRGDTLNPPSLHQER